LVIVLRDCRCELSYILVISCITIAIPTLCSRPGIGHLPRAWGDSTRTFSILYLPLTTPTHSARKAQATGAIRSKTGCHPTYLESLQDLNPRKKVPHPDRSMTESPSSTMIKTIRITPPPLLQLELHLQTPHQAHPRS
jgi:hypothetical protein